MHIICPHCTTSYAIDLATLGAAGRTVRCSRCKEVWLARPEDAIEVAGSGAGDGGSRPTAGSDDAAAEWDALAREDSQEQDTPGRRQPLDIEPTGRPTATARRSAPNPTGRRSPATTRTTPKRRARRGLSWFRKLFRPPASLRARGKSFVSLPTACAAMGALVLALMIWRVDVVRLLPQTATFYKMVGLEVNLRGLMFKDVKITSETVEGKPVLVIEGVIVGETRKPVELPRLRFSVRDAQGAEIYAWNAVLEQPVLKPGERAWFKSRLASPPPEGRNIDVRFFNRRDLASGNI